MFSLNKFFITDLKSHFKERKIFEKSKRKVFILIYCFTWTEILYEYCKSFRLKVSFLIRIIFNIYTYSYSKCYSYVKIITGISEYLIDIHKYSCLGVMRFSLIQLILLYEFFGGRWRGRVDNAFGDTVYNFPEIHDVFADLHEIKFVAIVLASLLTFIWFQFLFFTFDNFYSYRLQ